MLQPHRPILATRHLTWPDEAACADAARRLAASGVLRDPAGSLHLDLHGHLGAGKTTFVRHLLRALGVTGRIKSPTYALMEPYEVAGLAASHFDFYRFDDPREWADAGLRDVFAAPGLKLVEWPEQAAGVLPPADAAITLQAHDDGRRDVTIEAHTERGRALLAALDAA